MKKLIFLMLPLIMAGQEVPIGSWKDYLSYSSASYITLSPKEVFCVSSKGLFKLNKEDQLITRMSKVTGLSDVEIKLIEHDIALNISVIVYENCNIDLIKEALKVFKKVVLSVGCLLSLIHI